MMPGSKGLSSDPFPCKGTKFRVQFDADVMPAVPLRRKPRCAAAHERVIDTKTAKRNP